jgi:DNA-binding NarL/FixJ family response regulator
VKVLIVDSAAIIGDRLHEMIAGFGDIAVVHSVYSVDAAFASFAANRHNLVVLDINLPDNGVLRLLKEIKKTSVFSRVVVLYTRPDRKLHEQCRISGADYLFDKYYEFDKIGKSLEDM